MAARKFAKKIADRRRQKTVQINQATANVTKNPSIQNDPRIQNEKEMKL